MLKKLIFVLLLLIVVAACGTASTAEPTSGVEGHVTIGPACPVERIDSPCPDKPYQATLVILDAHRKKVAEVQTDAAGAYKVALEPGEYILQPQSPNVMPYAQEQPFSVEAGKFTTVDVVYDSGIR